MQLSKISDELIKDEYVKRFRLPENGIIRSGEDAAKHLETYLGKKRGRECFVVVYLNGRNQIIHTEILFEGTLTTAAVYPREVVKRIVKLGAAAILIAHNHPSGNPSPSNDDRIVTRKIKDACLLIDVQLHDHIILVPGGGYTSFADKGIL